MCYAQRPKDCFGHLSMAQKSFCYSSLPFFLFLFFFLGHIANEMDLEHMIIKNPKGDFFLKRRI
jgi:hypothetical protein